MKKLLSLAVFLLLSTGMLLAQAGVGTLSGTVMDSSRAVIPNATVVLTNKSLGLQRSMTTGTSGNYLFTQLTVAGGYTITVSASGFKTAAIQNVATSVGTTITHDVTLIPGGSSETVQVNAGDVEQVQTDTSAVSQLIDSEIWKSSPLEDRSQNDFVTLVAGATPDDGTFRGAAVNGARTGTGNYMVEGVDNNEQGQGGVALTGKAGGAAATISPDAIQEYRVLTHDYPAEYGRTGGFATDTVLKSGSNNWHGSLFEYNRIQALAANDFFSNRNGLVDHLVRNQFGGSLGGPIRKDKTFFFATLEIHHLRQGSPVTGVSYTQDFLNFVNSGAFEKFMESDPNGFCVQQTGAACPGALPGTAKLGSIFSSLQKSEPTAFPLATATPCNANNANCYASGITTSGILYPVAPFGQVSMTDSTVMNQNRGSMKIDHKLTTNDQLSFTYVIDQVSTSDTTGGSDGSFGGVEDFIGGSQIFGATYTHIFSPTLLNTFRAGYNRHVTNFSSPNTKGVPSIYTADSLAGGFGHSAGLPQVFTDNQFQYQDSLTKTSGRHTFKTGFEFIRTRNGSSFFNDVDGTFAFNGIEDLVTDGAFGQESDTAVFGGPTYGSFYQVSASVDPTTGLVPDVYRGYRANELAAYVQDDWKATSRLTLNLGVRWEYFGPPHNFRSGFDSNVYFGAPGTPKTNGNPFFPTTSFVAEVQGAKFIQKNSNIWNKDTNNFGPRIGIAYDLTGEGKHVIHAGYGIGFDRLYNNAYENMRFNSPRFADNNIGALDNGVAAAPAYQTGLYAIPFTGNSLLASFGGKPTPRHIDQNLVTAYYEQAHLGIQNQLAQGYILETDYVGTFGRKLVGLNDINNYDGRLSCPTSGAPYSATSACGQAGYTNGFSTSRFSSLFNSDTFRSNGYSSNYNSLQLSLRKGYAHGLQFMANYTFSKAMDISSDVFRFRGSSTSGTTDVLRPSNDYGPADFDVRHNFVLTLNYTTQWKKNNLLLGGWSVSPIIKVHSGLPIPLWDSANDPNKDGRYGDRPQYYGQGSIRNAIKGHGSPADGYLNAATTPSAAQNSFGKVTCPASANSGLWCDSPIRRNSLPGPGFANVDFGVLKHFPIKEGQTITFEGNFFNLFNHPSFDTPDGNIQDSTFGQSQKDSNGARVTQLSLRYDF